MCVCVPAGVYLYACVHAGVYLFVCVCVCLGGILCVLALGRRWLQQLGGEGGTCAKLCGLQGGHLYQSVSG